MKQNTFFFTTRLITLVLAVFAILHFTACGSDDEPSINDILSEKTSLVKFDLPKGTHFLYDYADSYYVGGDTFNISKKGETSLNLRQGKHTLIWITEKERKDNKLYDTHYDANRKMIVCNEEQPVISDVIEYAVSEVNVSDYYLPTQEVKYTSIMSLIRVVIYVEKGFDTEGKIVVIKGFPNIHAVSLTGKTYELGEPGELIESQFHPYNNYKELRVEKLLLCPQEGLDDIQMTVEMRDDDGKVVHTMQLPKFSVRRGMCIGLYGPLVSGSTSDWKIDTDGI